MRIELDSILTRERLNKFYDYAGMSHKLLWTVLAIVTVAFAAMFTVDILVGGFKSEALIFLIAVIVYDLLIVYSHFIAPKRRKFSLFKSHYIFTDDTVTITTVGEGVNENISYSYDKFFKCIVNVSDMYLYINRNYALIMDASSLNDEQIEFILGKINKRKKK